MTGATGHVVSGRYRLIEMVGRGGMGRVWRAHDEVLDREVAVKEVLLADGVPEELRAQLIARTEREARAAARLRHPSIVTVHDVTQHGGTPWIVMEYVAGPSLGGLLAHGERLEWARAAELGAALADALAHAHAAGVVHRDLKPDNVLLSEGRPIITDFGIARILDATQQLTHTNTVIGTPQYMPPEQLEGRRVEAPADLWALGATLYSAVEGRPPFTGDTLTSIVVAVLTRPVPPPRHAGPLGESLIALMSKEPGERPDARAAAERWRALLPGGGSGSAGGFGSAARTVQAPPPAPAQPSVVSPAAVPPPARTPVAFRVPTVADSPAAAHAAAPTVAAAPPAAATPARPNAPSTPSRRSVLIWGAVGLAATAGSTFAAVQALGHGKGSKGSSEPVTLPGHNSRVETVAFSPDGTLIASGDLDGLILLHNVSSHGVEGKFTVPKVNGAPLVFADSGRFLATPCTDGTIQLLGMAKPEVNTLESPAGRLGQVAVHPDGKTLAGAGEAEAVYLWDITTRKLKATITGFTDGISALAFSPDGKTLAACTSKDGALWLMAASGGSPVRLPDPPEHKNSATCLAFSPDSKKLAVARSGPFDVWDISSRTFTSIAPTGSSGAYSAAAYSPDGKMLATADALSGAIVVWDPVTRTENKDVRIRSTGQGAYTVAFCPDGKLLASAGEDRTVTLSQVA